MTFDTSDLTADTATFVVGGFAVHFPLTQELLADTSNWPSIMDSVRYALDVASQK